MNLTRLLPHQDDKIYLTDGGLETTMIFDKNIDLPHFAACELLHTEEGCQHLHEYYSEYAKVAVETKSNFIIESPTWRANPSWGKLLGYDDQMLLDLNHRAIAICKDIRDTYQTENTRMLISGCMGSHGDGYNPEDGMTAEEAKNFHSMQIGILKAAGVDFVSAFTMAYVEEAVGLALAARLHNIPVVISFTVETDGKLPTGMSLRDAIEQVDRITENYVSYYMINCAHPSHFDFVLNDSEAWVSRISSLRANASCKSHEELDESTELDEGCPDDLAKQTHSLFNKFNQINVLGGCCGTSVKHIRAMQVACDTH